MARKTDFEKTQCAEYAQAMGISAENVVVIQGRPFATEAGVFERLDLACRQTGFQVRGLVTKCVQPAVPHEDTGFITVTNRSGTYNVPDLHPRYVCTLVVEKRVAAKEGEAPPPPVVRTVKMEGSATFNDSDVAVGSQPSAAVLSMHAETRSVLRAARRMCAILGFPISTSAEELGARQQEEVPDDPGEMLVKTKRVIEVYKEPKTIRWLWEEGEDRERDRGYLMWIAANFRETDPLRVAVEAFLDRVRADEAQGESQEAAVEQPRAEVPSPHPTPAQMPDPESPMTAEQAASLRRLLDESGYSDPAAVSKLLKLATGREVGKVQGLTLREASWVNGYVRLWREKVASGMDKDEAKRIAKEALTFVRSTQKPWKMAIADWPGPSAAEKQEGPPPETEDEKSRRNALDELYG